MRLIERLGLKDGGARHLRGDVWEVRADSDDLAVRALFAKEGRRRCTGWASATRRP
jgi:hypothetical protein